MSSKPLYLRPHHGMCLRYFAGQGYSEAFTRHMAEIQAALTPGTPVELVIGADAICTACPNNLEGHCSTGEKSGRYDRETLSLCGLRAGQILPYGDFVRLVGAQILEPGLRASICGDCQWSRLCGES